MNTAWLLVAGRQLTGSIPREALSEGIQLGDLRAACQSILTALGKGIFRTSKTVESRGDAWGTWKEGTLCEQAKKASGQTGGQGAGVGPLAAYL